MFGVPQFRTPHSALRTCLPLISFNDPISHCAGALRRLIWTPMKSLAPISAGILLAAANQLAAQPVSLESWENSLDGWTVQQVAYTSGFSTTIGVTAGTFSLSLAGTNSPTYGQMVRSASTQQNTTLVAGGSAINLDVYAPSGSFGFFLQIDCDINNSDTGFVSLDGFSYKSANLGSETTLSFPISGALAQTLSTSLNPTEIIFQIGGGNTPGNETMYLDNVTLTPAPEPASLAFIGALGLFGVRRFLKRK
jgi:hypothetical protein